MKSPASPSRPVDEENKATELRVYVLLRRPPHASLSPRLALALLLLLLHLRGPTPPPRSPRHPLTLPLRGLHRRRRLYLRRHLRPSRHGPCLRPRWPPPRLRGCLPPSRHPHPPPPPRCRRRLLPRRLRPPPLPLWPLPRQLRGQPVLDEPHVLSPCVVGLANALSTGWANLGSAAAQLLMPLTYSFLCLGAAPSAACRAAFLLPATLQVAIALAVLAFAQDFPVEVNKVSRLDKKHRNSNVWKVLGGGLGNYRGWILGVTYGYSYGVELTMENILAGYFYERFELGMEAAGMVAFCFNSGRRTRCRGRAAGWCRTPWGGGSG